ncbi:hypothetical protein BQ8482_111636 [Mesorhizobium delmotii]|uniref:Uncharacterized protein n=1 Tax=Mesorhizobium delmotii TaxID=1631247 RepID=A0A2P9AF13_9HYPH|nr:hypothetical protein BQ8482_111636 [Mesorhizobium delmotii]
MRRRPLEARSHQSSQHPGKLRQNTMCGPLHTPWSEVVRLYRLTLDWEINKNMGAGL